MKLLNYRVPVVYVFPVVVFVLWVCSGYYMSKIDEAYSVTTSGVIKSEERANKIEYELEHLKMITSMAIEFNLSPLIVDQIYQESINIDRSNWLTWRFVKTPEYFTYLMCSIIQVESKGEADAIGDSGKALGLTQMWMSTARMHKEKATRAELLNPYTHIPIAIKHFVYLLEESNGNIGVAIIKWNRGNARVERLLNAGLDPENGYVDKVMNAARYHNSKLTGVGG